MPFQVCIDRQSSSHRSLTHIHIHTHQCLKIKNSQESLTFSFWLGIAGSSSFLSRPSEAFQQRQLYLWYWTILGKKKSPVRKKWEAQLGIFKAPWYISYCFSGQKFSFTKFLQLNLSCVSFSLFPFFFFKAHVCSEQIISSDSCVQLVWILTWAAQPMAVSKCAPLILKFPKLSRIKLAFHRHQGADTGQGAWLLSVSICILQKPDSWWFPWRL